jgi:methyltransferase
MVITLGAYLTIVSALAVERLYELFLSARNTRHAFAIGAVEAGRKHYLPMVAFHALFLGAAAAEAIVLRRPFPGLLGWAALGGTLGAQALRYWCIATLGPRWNTRIIVWPGLAPVSRGPYRFTRHPNYFAIIVEIACVPLIRGCWLTAIIFSAGNAMLLVQRIRAEEAAMGPLYAREFADRMRFIPLPARRRLDGRLEPRQSTRRGSRA